MGEKAMTGWKTRGAAIIFALGTSLVGAAEVAPTIDIGVWMKFAGTILLGFGTALGLIGIGHKIEKSG